MDNPSVFADPGERGTLGDATGRRLRHGLRLWQLVFIVATLLGFVLVVVLHDHGPLAGSVALADREQQARQMLSLPGWPGTAGEPLPPDAQAILASGGWLGVCLAGPGPSIRALAVSASWTADDCPPKPAGLSASPGVFTRQTLAPGREAVWSARADGGMTAVAVVFDTVAASAAIENQLRQSAASRAWVIAVLLALAAGLLWPQAQALARIRAPSKLLSAAVARRASPAPVRLGGAWVCEELWHLHERWVGLASERSRQGVRMNEALELLRQTWHFGSEAVLIVDAHGVVSFVNPAAQALLRGGPDTLLGADIGRLLPATSVESLTVRAGGATQDSWAVTLARTDGTTLEVDALATLCAVEEQPVFQVFLKPQAVAQAVAPALVPPSAAPAPSRERLIANVSHEIRTPLSGIMGMADLLANSPLQADQQEILATLRASTRQLRALLDDILDASKVEAGQLRIETIPFDICAQVKRCTDAFQAVARQKQLKLSLQLSVPHLVVVGDPLRVSQVLNNLLDNAMKFTAQGAVKVALAVEAPPGEGADVRVRLKVSDSGIGIPDSARAGIFEPFRQADSSTSRRYGGSGLGLTLCRELCRAMNGGIELTPVAGPGSTFSVWLDLRRGEVAKTFVDTLPVEWPAAEATLKGCRALVADDNRINQMLLTRWLQHEGVEVELAVDGEQAVRRASEGGLDIILMDLSMPVMNGLDATRSIRRLAGQPVFGRSDLATIPIIGVTAHALPGDRESCLESGMDEYITKPLKRHELVQMMSSAVMRHNMRQNLQANQATLL